MVRLAVPVLHDALVGIAGDERPRWVERPIYPSAGSPNDLSLANVNATAASVAVLAFALGGSAARARRRAHAGGAGGRASGSGRVAGDLYERRSLDDVDLDRVSLGADQHAVLRDERGVGST